MLSEQEVERNRAERQLLTEDTAKKVLTCYSEEFALDIIGQDFPG